MRPLSGATHSRSEWGFNCYFKVLVRSLMGVNAYWGELEALMKAVPQEIRVLLSPSECDGDHTTMGHGGAYTLLPGQS